MSYNTFLTEKANETIKNLETSLDLVLKNPESYINWVKQGLKFATYSPNNQSIIYFRFPEAKYVASYKKWESMGIKVNKGEKAIGLLAPNNIKGFINDDGKFVSLKNASDDEKKDIKDGKIKTITKMYGFRSNPVFDISQTNGSEADIAKLMENTTHEIKDVDHFLSQVSEIFEYKDTKNINNIYKHLKIASCSYINDEYGYTPYEKALMYNAMISSLFETYQLYSKEVSMLVINDMNSYEKVINKSNIELNNAIKDRIKVFLNDVIPYIN